MDAREIILNLINERFESDAAFEAKAGLKPKTVDNWKRKKSSSYLKMLPLLSEIFDVSVDYLLGKTDIPKLPDELKDVNVAFFDGAFDGLDEKDIDLLKQMAKRLKEQKNK